MMPRRLVLLVEGDGDVKAAPELVNRILRESQGYDALFVDKNPMRVGEYGKLVKNDCGEWRRFLSVAGKRSNLGGCLLLIDGDAKTHSGERFCVVQAARLLAEKAISSGAGKLFSASVVFARMEYESWLIAGAESLAGKVFADQRQTIPDDLTPPDGDLEVSPRDAKLWLRKKLKGGYSPVLDQLELTRLVDLNVIRDRPMRSYLRLENAIGQIVQAVRSGKPTVTPMAP